MAEQDFWQPPHGADEQLASRAARGVVIEVTPLGAFAGGALLVAALALAVAAGRHWPTRPATTTPAGTLRSLDELQRQPAIRYDELSVDRGTTM